MASHLSAQHSRYPHSSPQNNREEDALRLPSIRDLGFRYPSRRAQDPQESPSHASPASIAPPDPSIGRDAQDNSARWARSTLPVQSPVSVPPHLQQHQPQHHHHQQQLTPPLSAGHEPLQLKNEYSSKPDGPFMTPGLPLSAQPTPVHGSVTIGPGPSTRGDEPDQSKRRRSSGNMSTPRDQRSSHTAYPPHYAQYPPSQPPQHGYQMQPPMSHPGPPVQQPIDHVAAQQVAPPPHPGYSTYSPQYPPPPSRIPLHSAPQQQQIPPTGNPYPPAPVPPPHSPWEQSHHAQPPHQHQPPPPPQLQQPPPHIPPPQHTPQIQHPPHPVPHHPQPQPPPPPPSLLPQHHHMHPQHPQHHSQQPIAPSPLGHSQPQPHQPPPQIQQPQIPYARTTAIVPIDTRSQYPVVDERMPLNVRDSTMNEIMKHCQVLLDFASRYAQIQQSIPDVSPPPDEIQQMSHLAAEVVRLLEEYRRLNLPEPDHVKMDSAMAMTPPDDHRPPKRPWEDMSQDENSSLVESAFAEQQYPTPVENKLQSTAEQDMEIIRTKRATAGGSGSSTQPKSKYRKRSRATPPGKCHSCNIRETPEWRRGPDGARTLCNACGLHYAKLQRKRDKQAGPNGEALPRIDMETLRQSARAAEVDKTHSRSKNGRSHQPNESTSPMEPGTPLQQQQQHHQGSFQLVPMTVTQDPVSAPPPQQQQSNLGSAPTPPWQTSVQPPSTVRAYAPDQHQHQSFMRTSHQATNNTPAP
ncbi:GATA zinc finger domain-containing protein 10 [Termitomyces sp. T112]|nr:hypothetical protein C0989_008203 [Termitomyces sp. Mn162]KAG5721854.1 GATA zinc finger domain-containing protein 10 [Termitomyces sp. T112]